METHDPHRPTTQLIEPGHTYGTITDKISSIVLTRGIKRGWVFGFSLSLCLVLLLVVAITWLFVKGIGIWGVNQPVGWGFAIINFVWWIGIGHAGTLISAVLLLMRQKWRTSINRFAEAMTLFAVASAALFPILHLGRPQFFYWLFPYANTMSVWPQFRSPLAWDVFAISTYGLVSFLFWYVGLIPDVATMRDKARTRGARIVYGIMAMGWRGSAVHWYRYEMAYLLLAGLATPLVVSVHTIVGLDFAVSSIPGWHATIFPPYFVAGAIYSGFAMVVCLAIPLRRFYGLRDFITMRHLDNMAKVMLATGLIVAYGYMMEAFMGWYSANTYEEFLVKNRATGPYAPAYWALILTNVLIPQLLWSRRIRSSTIALFIISIVVNIGMWLERFVIVVTSLHRDYLPSSWDMYYPTFWDFATYAGTLGLFFFLLFLFIRFLPVISVFEMRELLRHESGHADTAPAHAAAHAPAVPAPAAPEPVTAATVPAHGPPRIEVLDGIARPWGVLAEFDTADAVLAATRKARESGYDRIDAYVPFPVEGLPQAIGRRRARLALLVLCGGIVGGVVGFSLQYFLSVHQYPLNVGGKPLNSWPAFIPITFELTILGASLTAVLGMLGMNRLPQPHHPLFAVPGFERATIDRFFLLVHSSQRDFERSRVREFLAGLAPLRVAEVAP